MEEKLNTKDADKMFVLHFKNNENNIQKYTEIISN